MPISAMLERSLATKHARTPTKDKANQVKHGAEIFVGTDYPQQWADFVGQRQAVEHLRSHLDSVLARDAVRLDHILLASGLHGIGKTTLAMLVAAQARTLVTLAGTTPGFVQVSGPMDVDQARAVLSQMDDGDILFWDEIHLAVAGGKSKSEWVLPFLTDGALLTSTGREEMPQVTVIGATTDAGLLPQTFISRFMVRPKLVPYTITEGIALVQNLATRMRVDVGPEMHEAIATAANCNPRDMRLILTAVRDLPSYDSQNLAKALEWAGFTADGLPTVAVDMLLVLLGSKDHLASIDTIQAQLGEPGTLRHNEQVLLQRGYVSITGRGRLLTEEGVTRAISAIQERA